MSSETTPKLRNGEVMKLFLKELYRRLAALPMCTPLHDRDPSIYDNLTRGDGKELLRKAASNVHVLLSSEVFDDLKASGAAFEARQMKGDKYDKYYFVTKYEEGDILHAVCGGLAAGASLGRDLEVFWVDQDEDDEEYYAKVFDQGSSVRITLSFEGKTYEVVLGSLCVNLLVVVHNDDESCKLFEDAPAAPGDAC